jgi:DNA-directed RNA polymerase subunit H (RpoH/RPB5)
MFNIYTNVRKCMENQNIALSTPLHDQANFMGVIEKHQCVVLEGKRKCTLRGDATITICLIDKGSKYTQASNDFKVLLNTLPKSDEVFIVCKEDLSSYIGKQIETFKELRSGVKLYIFPYKCFVMNIPTHVLSSKHEILSAEEVNALGKPPHYIQITNLPKIKETDVQAIWIGLRSGMVCRIYRPSETSGHQIVYRLCK